MTNPHMPGLFKVGRTQDDPEIRAKGLSGSTGIPAPFEVFEAVPTPDMIGHEKVAHKILHPYRVNPSREFFSAPVDEVRNMMQHLRRKVGLYTTLIESNRTDMAKIIATLNSRTNLAKNHIVVNPAGRFFQVFLGTYCAGREQMWANIPFGKEGDIWQELILLCQNLLNFGQLSAGGTAILTVAAEEEARKRNAVAKARIRASGGLFRTGSLMIEEDDDCFEVESASPHVEASSIGNDLVFQESPIHTDKSKIQTPLSRTSLKLEGKKSGWTYLIVENMNGNLQEDTAQPSRWFHRFMIEKNARLFSDPSPTLTKLAHDLSVLVRDGGRHEALEPHGLYLRSRKSTEGQPVNLFWLGKK